MNDDLKLIVYVSRYLGDRDEVDQVLNDIIVEWSSFSYQFEVYGLIDYY